MSVKRASTVFHLAASLSSPFQRIFRRTPSIFQPLVASFVVLFVSNFGKGKESDPTDASVDTSANASVDSRPTVNALNIEQFDE